MYSVGIRNAVGIKRIDKCSVMSCYKSVILSAMFSFPCVDLFFGRIRSEVSDHLFVNLAFLRIPSIVTVLITVRDVFIHSNKFVVANLHVCHEVVMFEGISDHVCFNLSKSHEDAVHIKRFLISFLVVRIIRTIGVTLDDHFQSLAHICEACRIAFSTNIDVCSTCILSSETQHRCCKTVLDISEETVRSSIILSLIRSLLFLFCIKSSLDFINLGLSCVDDALHTFFIDRSVEAVFSCLQFCFLGSQISLCIGETGISTLLCSFSLFNIGVRGINLRLSISLGCLGLFKFSSSSGMCSLCVIISSLGIALSLCSFVKCLSCIVDVCLRVGDSLFSSLDGITDFLRYTAVSNSFIVSLLGSFEISLCCIKSGCCSIVFFSASVLFGLSLFESLLSGSVCLGSLAAFDASLLESLFSIAEITFSCSKIIFRSLYSLFSSFLICVCLVNSFLCFLIFRTVSINEGFSFFQSLFGILQVVFLLVNSCFSGIDRFLLISFVLLCFRKSSFSFPGSLFSVCQVGCLFNDIILLFLNIGFSLLCCVFSIFQIFLCNCCFRRNLFIFFFSSLYSIISFCLSGFGVLNSFFSGSGVVFSLCGSAFSIDDIFIGIIDCVFKLSRGSLVSIVICLLSGSNFGFCSSRCGLCFIYICLSCFYSGAGIVQISGSLFEIFSGFFLRRGRGYSTFISDCFSNICINRCCFNFFSIHGSGAAYGHHGSNSSCAFNKILHVLIFQHIFFLLYDCFPFIT